MSYLTELRDSCLLCVRKHLSQALVLMQEARQGHPLHRWIAIGHMGEAADEALKVFPKLAAEIRKHRLRYMGDADYVVPVMDLIEKATNLVKQEGRVDMLPGGKGDKLDEKDVDPTELARGIEVELEHTKNRRLAKEIALDHLAEDPRYYTKLKRIHSESDESLRRNQRRAQIGDSSDKAAFYASLRRKGDDAVKSHFSGHAKEFIDAVKAHDEASSHWHDLRNSFDHDARKQADERLMSASRRASDAHVALRDAAHHYSQATGQTHHPAVHLHRGDAAVADHMHALARLHFLPKPTVDHSSKHTHVTVSQRQDNKMPFGFPGVDDFVRSVRHHYNVTPRVQKSGSTALVHVKVPLDKPKLNMESASEALARLRDPELPAEAPEDKAYVVLWADGRAIVAFRKKADAIAFIKHNDGDVVWARLDKPFTRAGTRITVRNNFTPSTNEDIQLTRTPLHEDLSVEERRALTVMAKKHGAGFDDEFWIEHRRQISTAEFSQDFAEWADSTGGWDGKEETRQEAWFRYLQSPEFKARERTRLQIEEREVNPDGSTSCGVFIPIPYDLARQFPDKKSEDDSVPHFTVLYAGALSPDDFRKLVATVRAIALAVRPFWLDLARYSEFVNPKGQVIAHMTPGPSGSSNLARLHGVLRRGLEALGVKIAHHYGPEDKAEKIPVPYEVKFKAHATLAYLSPTQPYTGPRPTGSWLVNEIEVWGHERVRIPLGSIDYSDSGAKLQRSALDMQIYMARKPYPRAVPLPVRSPLDGSK